MSRMQTRITVPANECAGHPSSWQEQPCWLIACLCWRGARGAFVSCRGDTGAGKYSSVVKKACQVCGVCSRLSCKTPLFPLPLPRLLSDNVSWIKSDQRSGIIFLPLSHNTAHSSAVLKYKLERQESSKAFPYISVWFQTELRGPRLMYAHVSRHLCIFKEYMPQSYIFLCLDVLQECKANCF